MLKYASVKSHYYFSTNFHYCFNLFYIKILTEIKSIIVTVGVKPRYFYVSHLTFFVTKPLYVVFKPYFLSPEPIRVIRTITSTWNVCGNISTG